jgi:hypothetical protein
MRVHRVSVLVRGLAIMVLSPPLLFSQALDPANPNTRAPKARLVPIDLATTGPSDTITIAPGVVQIDFTNLVPHQLTLIKISAGDPWSVPPLNPISFAQAGVPVSLSIKDVTPKPPDPCDAVRSTLLALDEVSDEGSVAAVSAAAGAAVAKAKQSSSAMDPTTGCPALFDSIAIRQQRTEHIDQHTWPFGFKSTEVATVLVQVHRVDSTGKILKSWNLTIRETTGTAPSWFATYGYAITAMGVIDHQQTYETKGVTIAPAVSTSGTAAASGTAGYKIVLSPNQELYRPTPMLLYHYVGNGAGDRAVDNGPTAGIGLSTSSTASGLVLLAGWSVIYHRNLAFTLGMTFLPGTHLGVPLDDVMVAPSATTINVQQYQWHPFFGVSFRFGSNPFAATAKPAAAPKPDSVVTPKPAKDTTTKKADTPTTKPDTTKTGAPAPPPKKPEPVNDATAAPAPVQKPRDW